MEAWSAPEVPRLPGQGPPLRLHDTATRELVAVGPEPGQDGPARLYVCGITPYDATHLGHAATYVAFDLVQRAWLDAGIEVTAVQNVTDVDDPLLERAREHGEDWSVLAERETALFREDMAALAVLPPAHYVGVVEAIPLVVDLLGELRARGAVYEVEGDLYFSVASDDAFGSLSGFDRTTMLALSAERGGDPDRPGKKDPLDPVLWQRERPGEPAWDSPYGRGRPGWHVECTAIAQHHLGNDFDVQGGGSDLVFPHHELSASQGRVATGGEPFARAYVHAGMVGLHGRKMSKSRGNLVFVSRLREQGIDPAAVRLALLAHHYRSDWDWSHEDLQHALSRIAAWREAVNATALPSGERVVSELRERLADDLDTPGAIAAVDRWVEEARGSIGPATGTSEAADEGRLVHDAVSALLGVQL